jgi:hypothetical protein
MAIGDLAKLLEEALFEIAKIGSAAFCTAHTVKPDAQWGPAAKIVKGLQVSGLINSATSNLAETVNIAATGKRLLETLKWVVEANSGLQSYNRVVPCHPSHTGTAGESDLTLTCGSHTARFEISDVAGSRDSNGKETTDRNKLLESKGKGIRLFLVTSDELGDRIRKKTDRYRGISEPGSTRISELVESDHP